VRRDIIFYFCVSSRIFFRFVGVVSFFLLANNIELVVDLPYNSRAQLALAAWLGWLENAP